jgi:hypothetical protein
VLPLDVYLENENELVQAATTGEVAEELEGTVGARLLRRDGESRVVVNFHGVSLSLLYIISRCPLSSSIKRPAIISVLFFSAMQFLPSDKKHLHVHSPFSTTNFPYDILRTHCPTTIPSLAIDHPSNPP